MNCLPSKVFSVTRIESMKMPAPKFIPHQRNLGLDFSLETFSHLILTHPSFSCIFDFKITRRLEMLTISLLMMSHDDPAQRPQPRRVDMEHIGLILSELGLVSLQPATRLFKTVSQFTRGQTRGVRREPSPRSSRVALDGQFFRTLKKEESKLRLRGGQTFYDRG